MKNPISISQNAKLVEVQDWEDCWVNGKGGIKIELRNGAAKNDERPGWREGNFSSLLLFDRKKSRATLKWLAKSFPLFLRDWKTGRGKKFLCQGFVCPLYDNSATKKCQKSKKKWHQQHNTRFVPFWKWTAAHTPNPGSVTFMSPTKTAAAEHFIILLSIKARETHLPWESFPTNPLPSPDFQTFLSPADPNHNYAKGEAGKGRNIFDEASWFAFDICSRAWHKNRGGFVFLAPSLPIKRGPELNIRFVCSFRREIPFTPMQCLDECSSDLSADILLKIDKASRMRAEFWTRIS